LLSSPRIKKPTSYEFNQILELLWGQIRGNRQERVDPLKYRLNWTEAIPQVVVDASRGRIVRSGEGGCIQVVTDRIFQLREGTVVEESRLQRSVPQG
jgi:hypothetical protein